ncbi:hypothetical protein [Lacipirellula parvula]|uniref:Uncharacterized protein n=1 Tax=Lacipirellula parvula TaxID=2650471 RepID=A0A5K7XHS2_9BACT|nr:hypothetical protein [Lacipirellula parvula]BBO36454.1 hypothetical protein PLANPX_6066 [Lacipirellula parvula]
MKVWLFAISAMAIVVLFYWNSALGLAAVGGVVAYRYNFWRMLDNLWHSFDD